MPTAQAYVLPLQEAREMLVQVGELKEDGLGAALKVRLGHVQRLPSWWRG